MAEIWANFSGESYPEKDMEMAWLHPQESLESSWESKKRPSTEHLERFARSRNQVHGKELVSTREGCTGQEAMERGAPV